MNTLIFVMFLLAVLLAVIAGLLRRLDVPGMLLCLAVACMAAAFLIQSPALHG